jgi:hypothetical protein
VVAKGTTYGTCINKPLPKLTVCKCVLAMVFNIADRFAIRMWCSIEQTVSAVGSAHSGNRMLLLRCGDAC